MMRNDTNRDAATRRRTWIRDRDRRDSTKMPRVVTVARPADELLEFVTKLSGGRIGSDVVRDIVSGGGDTTVEIVVNPLTGLIERWSLKTRFGPGEGGSSIAPAA